MKKQAKKPHKRPVGVTEVAKHLFMFGSSWWTRLDKKAKDGLIEQAKQLLKKFNVTRKPKS